MPKPVRSVKAPAPSTAEIVQVLADRVRQLETGFRPAAESVSSGLAPLDRLLPGKAFRRGTLVEWLAAEEGSGAGLLALTAAREACRQGGALVVLDRERSFYPPAAAAWGIDLEKLIVVRPSSKDESWALDQVLRSAGVAAVLSWPPRWPLATGGRSQRRAGLADPRRKHPRRSLLGRSAAAGRAFARPAASHFQTPLARSAAALARGGGRRRRGLGNRRANRRRSRSPP